MKPATYRVIHFTKPNRYVGLAWNYDLAVLVSTQDFETYTQARIALGKVCIDQNVQLKWFDGEYECTDGETLQPCQL